MFLIKVYYMYYCEHVCQKIYMGIKITQHFMTAETGGIVSVSSSKASVTPGNIQD